MIATLKTKCLRLLPIPAATLLSREQTQSMRKKHQLFGRLGKLCGLYGCIAAFMSAASPALAWTPLQRINYRYALGLDSGGPDVTVSSITGNVYVAHEASWDPSDPNNR